MILQKPTSVSYSSIPQELKDLRKWTTWVYTTKDGVRRKLPIMAGTDRLAAKVNDPQYWARYNDCVRMLETRKHHGLTFALTGDYTLIDLDWKDTNSREVPLSVLSLIEYFDSYTEVSSSGQGIHILVRGDLPKEYKHRFVLPGVGVEIYSKSRFCSMTGALLGDRGEIKDGQMLIDSFGGYISDTWGVDIYRPVVIENARPKDRTPVPLTDDEILERAYASNNGKTFQSLYEGDVSEYTHVGENGRTPADLSLVLRLMFWTNGERERVDRMFRESGLMRPKWDRVHSSDGRTYGELTIDSAERMWDGTGYKPGKPKLSFTDAADKLIEQGLKVLTMAQGNGPAKAAYKSLWMHICELIRENRFGTNDQGKYLILGGLRNVAHAIGGTPDMISARLKYLSSMGFIGQVRNEDLQDRLSPLIIMMPEHASDLGIFKISDEQASFLVVTGVKTSTLPPKEPEGRKVKSFRAPRLTSARYTYWYLTNTPGASVDALVVASGARKATIKSHLAVLRSHGLIDDQNNIIADYNTVLNSYRLRHSKLQSRILASLEAGARFASTMINRMVFGPDNTYATRHRTLMSATRKLNDAKNGIFLGIKMEDTYV